MIPTLTWTPEGVRFIDQTKLPLEESYVLATTYEQVADVIVTMVVRGAPAIGVSAAYGVALGALRSNAATAKDFAPEFETICARLAGTRPTAVNLFWAIDRMKRLFANLRLDRRHDGRRKAETPLRSSRHVRRRHRRMQDHGRFWRRSASGRRWSADSLQRRRTWRRAVTERRSASFAPPSSRASASTFMPTRRGRFCKARDSPRGN